MGFVSVLTRTILDMCVVTLVILIAPGFPPFNTFTNFRLPDSPDWDGPLQANTKLNLVDRIFENQIKGPESFAVHDGHLYTGLMSGLIVKIDPDDLSITPVARVGTDCEGQHEDVKCGRPLGLEFTQDGDLLVCDAVFGLYLVKFNPQQDDTVGRITSHRHQKHNTYEPLIKAEDILDGSPNTLFNSVVLGKDNQTVYVTVSSTKFPLRDGMFELISDPTGRLLQFDLVTRQAKVILDKLNFANGLAIDRNGEFLLVSETGRAAIHKHYLAGPKQGVTELLTDKLPGLPDNIRANDRGNFFVGVISPRLPNTWHVLELVAPHNLIRKFVSRLIYMVLMPVKFMNYIVPTTATRKFEYWCGNLEPFAQLAKPYGLVVEIDGETGEIISSMHSTNGAVRFISEAIILGRWIYLGSPYNNYLARIPSRLRDLGPGTTDPLDDVGFDDIESIEDNIVVGDPTAAGGASVLSANNIEASEAENDSSDSDTLDIEYEYDDRIEL